MGTTPFPFLKFYLIVIFKPVFETCPYENKSNIFIGLVLYVTLIYLASISKTSLHITTKQDCNKDHIYTE